MAIRCFGRVRLAVGAARALVLRSLALTVFRAVDLAAILRVAALRTGDFFCAVVRPAARAVGFFVGFFLAIDVLPFGWWENVSKIALRRVGKAKRAHRDTSTVCGSCGGHGANAPLPTLQRSLNQCSRNTPSTARSSAGLI